MKFRNNKRNVQRMDMNMHQDAIPKLHDDDSPEIIILHGRLIK